MNQNKDDKKKPQSVLKGNEQILIEDGTLSAFGLNNPSEIPVKRK